MPENSPPLKLIAKAIIDGKDVVRKATGTLPKLIEPGDIVTTTEQDAVTVKPGAEVRLQVKIDRPRRLSPAASRWKCAACRTASACWTSG